MFCFVSLFVSQLSGTFHGVNKFVDLGVICCGGEFPFDVFTVCGDADGGAQSGVLAIWSPDKSDFAQRYFFFDLGFAEEGSGCT